MAIEADYMRYSLLRDLGRGPAFPLTATVPGGLQAEDRFYRTDLHWDCYYTGSAWVTRQEFSTTLGPTESGTFTHSFAASTNTIRLGQLRSDYRAFLTRFEATIFVLTTNNGSNYWTLTLRDSSAAAVLVATTAADAANANVSKVYTDTTSPTLVSPAAARTYLSLDVATTGAPGAFYPRNPVVFYRMIVT